MCQEEMILVLDTETTGLIKGPRPRSLEQYPYITQITAILYSIHTRKIVAVLNEYVRLPENVLIEETASAITGITQATCQEKGRPLQEILPILYEMLLSCRLLVAHNYEFDGEILQAELHRHRHSIPAYCTYMLTPEYLERLGIRTFCTMKQSLDMCGLKNAYGRPKYPRLIELHRALFGMVQIEGPLHNSAVDTAVCLKCFLKLHYRIVIPDAKFAEMIRELSATASFPMSPQVSSRTRLRFP